MIRIWVKELIIGKSCIIDDISDFSFCKCLNVIYITVSFYSLE